MILRGPGGGAPPGAAVRLLDRTLSAGERDGIIGDLTEVFADRVDARRPFNRIWFWAHAIVIACAATVKPEARSPAAPAPWRQFMGRLGASAGHAWRRLIFEWRYAAAVILILAVGIGPAAAMLSVVQRVLLRPLDFREPERIGLLRVDLGQLRNHPGLSPAEAIDLRASGLFAAVETETRLADVTLGTPPNLESLTQLAFTTGMLPLLGVSPALGRSFTEADMPPPPPPPSRAAGMTAPPSVPMPPQPALIDYGTWQSRFGGDPAVLGRTVPVNGRPTEIVGVLPSGFRLVTGRGVPQRIDIYTPIRLNDDRNAWQFPTLARLKPGATFEQAQAGLDALAANLKRQYPAVYDGRLRFTIAPALDDMTRATKPALRAGAAAVLLLLVIAFANATALVVARQKSCERDFAIRSAIGATRGALILQVLVESLLLALGGAVAGSLIALGANAAIREVIPRTVPRWDQVAAGWELLVYPVALALAGLLAIGLIPVWTIVRRASWEALRSGSVQGGRAEGTVSRLVLVGSQIALTVVLAFGCAQLVRSAERLRHVDLGFDPEVLTLRVPYDTRVYNSPSKRAILYQRLRDRVSDVPGVVSVGVTTHVPLSGSTMLDGYQADLSKEPSFDQSANYQAVTPGYFASLRIPMRQGRDFTDQEDAQGQPVVVVDETLVQTVFPGERQVLGRMLRLGWGLANARIVGVVGHARTIEVGRAVRPQIYTPVGNLFQQAGILTVRADGDPRMLAGAVTAAIREVGPGRAVSSVAMLSDNVADATSTLRAVTGLVTFLAVSAGTLSAIGLYLVIAFVVHERRRATAIRTALGASPRRVMWHHLRTSALVMLAALPLGVLLSLAAAPFVADLVYGIGDRDGRSLALGLGVAVLSGALGTYVPVRRAANANVVKVLRES